jgi:Divergent InlB B-repeat domain
VTPVTWCGGEPSATDRPDIVGGDQIHVVYASPNDSTDRFPQTASAIATDIGAISAWWRRQDPTRAPRFDLAGFSCSGFGSLDISDVRLPHSTSYYNQAGTPRLQVLRDDLLAAGFDDSAKKYLVYYDQAQPALGTDCGAAYVNAESGGAHGYAGVYLAPNLGGCGSIDVHGGRLAVIAAHELVNELGALDLGVPGPPHRCPTDSLHTCDSPLDVLASSPTARTLGAAVLDDGHDDYYAHSGSWWDVQDSAWLRHLDAGEYRVRVTVGAGGQSIVDTSQSSVTCAEPSTCVWTWPAGSALTLAATPASGYRFLRWTGCPAPQGDACTITVDRPSSVGAVFALPLRGTGFHLAFSRDGSQLTATLHLSAAGVADHVGCAFARRPVIASSLRGLVATCTWSVPAFFRGHRLLGTVELDAKGEALVAKAFHVRVPKR